MSTADFSHIGQEFQPTEGQQASASHGTEAKAGDKAFCSAVAAYVARYRDMSDDHRERILLLLEWQAKQIGFGDLRAFLEQQERDSVGGLMQQAM